MVSVNVEAKKTVDVMIEKADALNIAVSTLDNGATVLDCGVNVDGSFKAGELYTKVCLGGLADVGISIPGDLSEKFALPSVKIKTDSPSISTLGSQKAGWSVSVGDFFALGSGPARAIALKPAETYEEIGYELKYRIYKEVGIPICVGAAPTKTLAKLYNKKAKDHGGVFIYNPDEIDSLLASTDCGRIWGNGPARAKKLQLQGNKFLLTVDIPVTYTLNLPLVMKRRLTLPIQALLLFLLLLQCRVTTLPTLYLTTPVILPRVSIT